MENMELLGCMVLIGIVGFLLARGVDRFLSRNRQEAVDEDKTNQRRFPGDFL